MAPIKTIGYVLRTLPYRETSLILSVYTRELGLVQGVAKGIRKQGKERTIVERGFLIEFLAYGHEGHGLYTLGAVAVVDFFPVIRDNLVKTALRDTILETFMSGVHDSQENRSLFEFLSNFLGRLENAAEADCFPFSLWRFCVDFAAVEGFGLVLDRCGTCGGTIGGAVGGNLKTDNGVMVCGRCERPNLQTSFIPGNVADFINCQLEAPSIMIRQLPAADLKRITRLLLSYCRYHFDNRYDSRSLGFLEELIEKTYTRASIHNA